MKNYNLLTTHMKRGQFIGKTVRIEAINSEHALYNYISTLTEIDTITLKAVRVLNKWKRKSKNRPQ